MLVGGEYTSPTLAAGRRETSLSGFGVDLHPLSSIRKSKSKYKKRFSDAQIRTLESTFHTESRPEQRQKQQLANQLRLQPRQVAIWFQNRRARSKSKQIEQDYNMLKLNYDTLSAKFESLKEENQSLLIQLQRLRNLIGKSGNEEHENQTTQLVTEKKPNFLPETCNHEIGMPSCDDSSKNVEYFGEETDALNMAELPDGSLRSIETGCSFESIGLLEDSSCNSHWWEF